MMKLAGKITCFLLALFTTTLAMAETAPLLKRPGVWAQSYTGRPADPAVRFGQLPNGLRYAILHNERPTGSLSLRLRIGSGSLAEQDDQQGLAHFLEHLAFRGSTHVPDGEVKRILERQGLRFGPDTNAFTSFDQTVYMFDFPHADASNIESGLMLFREIASHLTIDPAIVETERGVVLAEERLRDTPAFRAYKQQLAFQVQGQLLNRRLPIGQVEIIKTASAATIHRYYETNYQPANATVIAVGDIDVDAMEAAIKAKFSDWQNSRPVPTPDVGSVRPRDTAAHVFSAPGAPETLALAWVKPVDASADTHEYEVRDIVRQIALSIFNKRLQDQAQGDQPPFLGAGAAVQNLYKSARIASIGLATTPGRWQQGMQAVVEAEKRITRDGIEPSELARAIAEARTQIQAAIAGKAGRLNTTIAGEILNAVNDDEVYVSPEQARAEIETVLPSLTPAKVQASLVETFAGAGPLLFRATPEPQVVSDAELTKLLSALVTAPVAKTATTTTKPWPYTSFGTPGTVLDRQDSADLGITRVHFANGTTLAIKPTNFTKDQILVRVGFGHGRLGLPPTLTRAYWLLGVNGQAFVLGGTGKLPFTDIQHDLEAKIVDINLEVQDTSFALSGTTRPADFATQLQLLAAYVTDPGFRPNGVTRLRDSLAANMAQFESSHTVVLQKTASLLLKNGDRRWQTLPESADLAATKTEDLAALLREELAQGALDVSIVGDVKVDEAIDMVARTFGALPKRARVDRTSLTEQVIALTPARPQPFLALHKGRADQAYAVNYWPLPDFYAAPKDARALGLAASVLRSRLFDQLRAADGVTYSPNAGAQQSTTLRNYGYFSMSIEVPPNRIAFFQSAIDQLLAQLKDQGITADEFTRARQPVIDEIKKARETNSHWLNLLTSAALDPRAEQTERDRLSGVLMVTPADVERVIRRYLVGVTPLRLEIKAVSAEH